MDLYELGRLALARDLNGTWWWIIETGASRYLGSMAGTVVDAFRDAVQGWAPWTDPDWPPQV